MFINYSKTRSMQITYAISIVLADKAGNNVIVKKLFLRSLIVTTKAC